MLLTVLALRWPPDVEVPDGLIDYGEAIEEL